MKSIFDYCLVIKYDVKTSHLNCFLSFFREEGKKDLYHMLSLDAVSFVLDFLHDDGIYIMLGGHHMAEVMKQFSSQKWQR